MTSSGGRRRALRVGAAAVAMIAVGEIAVWLLRPGERPITPAPVSEGHYFTSAQIARGSAYSDGQRWLFLAALGAQGTLLIVLALGRPRPARRALERLGRRPVLGAVAAGAGVSAALAVVALPAGVALHERAVDYDISTQSIGSWFADTGKSAAIGAVLAGAGAALLIALVRRFGGRWWIPGTLAVGAIAVVFTWLAPVVLAPVFNRFTPLPPNSAARSEVVALARRAGVDVGGVYSVDASRRSRALNAYVVGIGSTRRVVLYDTLLRRANHPELRSVVAHELGHVKHDDLWRGLAFLALVAPFGVFFARELAAAALARSGADPGRAAAVPAYALGLAVASLVIGVISNQLSRRVEASADTFALRLTHDPQALIAVQKRLALSSVADPSPPAAATALFGTHPSTIDRIGAAVEYEREHRSD